MGMVRAVMIAAKRWDCRLAAAGVALLCAGAALAAEPRDTMVDLAALAVHRSWHELGAHLRDIAPAARDGHWQSLVEEAAIGELSDADSVPGAEKFLLIAGYDRDFPTLVQSPKYLALRGRVGLEATRGCFDDFDGGDAGVCWDALQAFLHARPVDAGFAKSAAQMVARKLTWGAAAIIYVGGTEAPGGEALCTAPDLADAAVAALDQPTGTAQATAGKRLLGRCFEQVKAPVLGAFGKETPDSPFLRNACPALVAHKALSGLRAARCADLAKE
jgi:hypothetical protein